MLKQIGRAEADERWGQILEDVSEDQTHYVVERDGEPVVAVVPMSVYEEWKRDRDPFLVGVRDMARRANLTPEEADALAEEAVEAIRRGG